jgi:phosphatidylserine/phosphatidylglycerophosphate/cardiolipin synthase-like enzyme
MRSKMMKSGVVAALAAFVAISAPQASAWEFSSIYHQAKDEITGKTKHEEHRTEDRRDLGAGNPGVSHVELDHVQATVAFSPDGGGERIIVDAIDQARSSVLVQAYGFTDKNILRSLVNAKKRGVDVKILLDKSNDTAKYSGATYVANAGIPVWIDDRVAIAHNKVMIIDNSTVITGSFNFTTSAQKRNAENVLVLRNAPQLAATYTKDWDWRRGESVSYERWDK